jgi:hypothetical protein
MSIALAETKKDPRPRKDGACVVCKKKIEVSPRSGINPALYIDPFCSGVCARVWHKISDN